MAYLGSTQSSSVANPPIQMFGAVGAGPDVRLTGGSTLLYTGNNYQQSSTATVRSGLGSGQGFWMYNTTDMTSSPWNGSYFTDGGALGMRPGDVVCIVSHATTVMSSYYLSFAVVGYVTTDGTAVLSTGSLVRCTT
jgi:hypothetical protein